MGQLSCKVCGFVAEHPLYEIREMMFGLGEIFQYSQCIFCQTIQLVDIPLDIGKYYPDNYYAYSGLMLSSKWVSWIKELRLKIFYLTGIDFIKPIYGDWLKELNAKPHHRIADVGCGNGQLLYEMYSSGYRDLTGIDPFILKDVEVNSSLRFTKGTMESTHDKFDIIMMHHALEHMPDPIEAFEQARDLLVNGGKLLIRIPVSDAEAWKIYGVNWVQLDAPRHYIIPSVKGISLLAKNSGFNLRKVVFDSNEFQFWGSELYQRGIAFSKVKDATFFSGEELKDFKKKSLRLNQEGKGDQACFYLEKQ